MISMKTISRASLVEFQKKHSLSCLIKYISLFDKQMKLLVFNLYFSNSLMIHKEIQRKLMLNECLEIR